MSFDERARTRVGRHQPLRAAVVEALRLGHVVAAEHVGLRLEEVLRVAEVLPGSLGHLRGGGEEVGERLLVRLDDRVLLVEHVEGDGALVGVDGRPSPSCARS